MPLEANTSQHFTILSINFSNNMVLDFTTKMKINFQFGSKSPG